MKMLSVVALSFLNLFFCLGQEVDWLNGESAVDSAGNEYFSEPELARYSIHLAALNEPSLLELNGKKDGNVFRFTYIPEYQKSITFRAFKDPAGPAYVVVKRLSGPGGYELGTIEINAKVRITARSFQMLEERALSKGVKGLIHELGEDAASYCLGVPPAWIVEFVVDGEYNLIYLGDPHFLKTVKPENAIKAGMRAFGKPIEIPNLDEFIRFCDTFLYLTDMKLPEKDISGMKFRLEDEEGGTEANENVEQGGAR